MKSLVAAPIACATLVASIWAGLSIAPTALSTSVPTQSPSQKTSVLTIFAKKEVAAEPITLVFGGDVMLDRAIRNKSEALGYTIFDDSLIETLSSADIAIVNLEGPVTDLPSVSTDAPYLAPESFSFTFEPASLSELVRAGIDIVSLGNNHIRDRGPEGVRQSALHLDAQSISHFGTPSSESSLSTIIERNGITFGFIAYNQFIPTVSDERFVELVRELASSTDFIVVFPHWGNEYETIPTAKQALLARSFIDAGADLIVGAHPHVIQSFETYNNRAVAYSLGNLIFDQWFNESVRAGALLRVTIDPNERTYTTSAVCTYLNRDATTVRTECTPTVAADAQMYGAF
jgi:poly-gamma-glutamate synthesis protein (capsule biosynthesis protein)